MVAPAIIPAIRETIKQNEIGDGSAYQLSYACLGKSGASFGFMQGDTNVSAMARDTLRNALTAGGMPAAAVTRVLAAVSKALPNGSPLSKTDQSAVNAALASAGGRPIVDAMDARLLQSVLNGVDSCVAAAQSRQVTIAPLALLYIAPWINMSGPPTLLKTWLAGSSVMGLPVPPPPQIEAESIETYLQATAYFQAHPRNFVHYRQCVAIGAKLLPG